MISVIVPVYNDWRLIERNLAYFLAAESSCGSVEFIFVDNGSDWIPNEEYFHSNMRLLHCSSLGSYAARNLGVRNARGEILAFTDADCLPSPQWLADAVAWYAKREPEPVLLAGAISMYIENQSACSFCALFDLALGLPQARYVRRGYAVTANLFVPRAVFDMIGLFDEKRLSGGDAEFCRRASGAGIALEFCKTAEVRHPARSSWQQLASKARRVKGGQLLHGTLISRLKFILATLFPPLRAWYFIMCSPHLGPWQKIIVCAVQFRLWGVELAEMWRLLVLRHRPQR